MATNSRIVETEQARGMLLKYIENKKVPFVCTITDGVKRSTPQNKTMHMWFKEVADQLADRTASDVKCYAKLHFGVAILRESNEAFREQYDRIVKPLPYESKLSLMGEPIDFPVSRLMGVREAMEYMDKVYQHFTALGVILTNPDHQGVME